MKERQHQIAQQTDDQPVCVCVCVCVGGGGVGGRSGEEGENHANTMYQVLTSYNCGSK